MIEPKFKIGQRVFCVRVGWTKTQVICPDCLGTKEWQVILPSGEEFKHRCATCVEGWYCTGFVTNWGDAVNIAEYTVGSIQINTADENPVRYMCKETGVGSGSVYEEDCLFPDRPSAEVWGATELERVKGRRQAEELKSREGKKNDSLIYGDRKKKDPLVSRHRRTKA